MKKASKGNRAGLIPNPSGKLFDQLREVMRFHHYSYRTEKTYAQWIRRFLTFHRNPDRAGPNRGWRHPRDMGALQIAAFLRTTGDQRKTNSFSQELAEVTENWLNR